SSGAARDLRRAPRHVPLPRHGRHDQGGARRRRRDPGRTRRSQPDPRLRGRSARLMGGWTPEALRAEVATRTWFHTIDLGDGVVTPGHKDTRDEVRHFRIPDDLTGTRVLDVGAFDGFYAFEAERRGASRVVACDHWSWTWPGSD